MRKPIPDHSFHNMTDAELSFILKDAKAAAKATGQEKYFDQVNDACTVINYRKTLGIVPTTCIEHAYGDTVRLSHQVKVF